MHSDMRAVAAALSCLVVAQAGAMEPPAKEAGAAKRVADAAAARGHVDIVMTFEAADGTPLEGKLSLPRGWEEVKGGVPVVFYLHGAGPRSYDNPFRYVGEDGEQRVGFFLDYHAGELAGRGVGFFRMSKRGCTAFEEAPWMKLDRGVFSGATMSVLLGDYEAGLRVLRGREEIDAGRVVLVGSSEGTRLAPQLAKRSPEGIIGIAMMGFAADNARDTVVWQLTTGPWRNVQKLVPAARDGELTREEFDVAVAERPELAQQLPFEAMDVGEKDGVLDERDLAAAVRPRLDAILKAVGEKNDELLWRGLMNLSSGYLLEWWEAGPNVEALLELDIPLAIFHGELDGTCRVEGVREAEGAFKGAGKGNLFVKVYPEGDHDLGWAWEKVKSGEGVEGYEDVFEWVAGVVRDQGER